MPIAVVFPGQGSQKVGMEQELGSLATKLLAQADEVLNCNLSQLVINGPAEALNLTLNAQPALFVLNYAYWQALQAKKVTPAFLAGHSLGELSAYAAAEVYDFLTGLKIVQKRAQLMQAAAEKVPGVMLAVLGLDDKQVQAVSAKFGYEVANYNCPGQVVVSLKKDEQEKASEAFKAAGARKVVPLAVSGAFHCSLMKGAAAEFSAFLETVAFNNPKIPVISNVTARPVNSSLEVKNNLAKQITASVRWTETINYLKSKGVNCIIEGGPSKVLSGLIKRMGSEITVKHGSELL